MDWKEIGSTTWGATQASISVLLVMTYGYGSMVYKLLTRQGAKNISKITTTLFLPALFFSEIGPEATFSKLIEYWPIIIFAFLNLLVSFLYASFGSRIFGSAFPRWVVPSCMFNNVITLPLLMLESLGKTGALDDIITDPSALPGALKRAKNYFLLNALIYNLAKFSVAPSMMLPPTQSDAKHSIGSAYPPTPNSRRSDYEDLESEHTPLLSTSEVQATSHWTLSWWPRLKGFMNPPLIGGLVAIFVGVVPPLRRMFLVKDGVFTGSLTQSIEKLGDVYAVIQMLVVGAQLYVGSRRATEKTLPKLAMVYLLTFRFILMPAFSISLIYNIRRWKPNLFLKDPLFDFALMVAPVGPPAITIAAVAEIANLSEEENGIIARMLTMSYMVAPLISLPIAAALVMVQQQGLVYTPPSRPGFHSSIKCMAY